MPGHSWLADGPPLVDLKPKAVTPESGPLSQWLVNALTGADLPVICVETRHMKALLTARQINKTDRSEARGIA
jgi:transposase